LVTPNGVEYKVTYIELSPCVTENPLVSDP
jgi:hypothetical protein